MISGAAMEGVKARFAGQVPVSRIWNSSLLFAGVGLRKGRINNSYTEKGP